MLFFSNLIRAFLFCFLALRMFARKPLPTNKRFFSLNMYFIRMLSRNWFFFVLRTIRLRWRIFSEWKPKQRSRKREREREEKIEMHAWHDYSLHGCEIWCHRRHFQRQKRIRRKWSDDNTQSKTEQRHRHWAVYAQIQRLQQKKGEDSDNNNNNNKNIFCDCNRFKNSYRYTQKTL